MLSLLWKKTVLTGPKLARPAPLPASFLRSLSTTSTPLHIPSVTLANLTDVLPKKKTSGKAGVDVISIPTSSVGSNVGDSLSSSGGDKVLGSSGGKKVKAKKTASTETTEKKTRTKKSVSTTAAIPVEKKRRAKRSPVADSEAAPQKPPKSLKPAAATKRPLKSLLSSTLIPKVAQNVNLDTLNYRGLQKIARSVHLNAKLPREELISLIKEYEKCPQDFATPLTLESLTLFDIRFIAKTYGISPSTKKLEIIRILREEKQMDASEDGIKAVLSQVKRKAKRTGRDELPMLQQVEQLETHGYSHGQRTDTLPIVKAFEVMIQSIQKTITADKKALQHTAAMLCLEGADNIPANLPIIMYTAEEADHFLAMLEDHKIHDFDDDVHELDEELVCIYRRIAEDALVFLKSPSADSVNHALPVLQLSRPRVKAWMHATNVVGDIGGHFDNLMYILSEAIGGFPSAKNSFVFLGNIISPPLQSAPNAPLYFNDGNVPTTHVSFANPHVDALNALRCIFALLFLKLASPNAVHILRSNETLMYLQREVQRISAEESYSEDYKTMWIRLLEVYQLLPVAAVLEKSVFLCPGGVGPLTASMTIEEMNQTLLSPGMDATTLPCWMKELILAEPIAGDSALKFKKKLKRIAQSHEVFTQDYTSDFRSVQSFLERNRLHHIVRASKQHIPEGVKAFHARKMLSLYSAPHISQNGPHNSGSNGGVSLDRDGDAEEEDAKGAVMRFEHPTTMEYHVIPFLTRLNEE